MKRLYTRIYLHLVGVLLVVGLATSLIFTSGFRTEMARAFSQRLARHSASLVGEHLDDRVACEKTLARLSSELEVNLTLRDPSGATIASIGPEVPAGESDLSRVAFPGAGLFGRRHNWSITAPILDEQGRVRATLAISPMHHFRHATPLRPLAFVTTLLVLLALATAPLARRISRPVERLTEATRRLGAGDLGHRVPLGSTRTGHRADELEELTRAWNEMADRVEQLVRGQKELLANVSHELRSPLARIRVALELVPRTPDSATRIADVEADLSELDRLIDDVLTTSRLETTGLPTRVESLEARALLSALCDRAARDPLLAPHAVSLEAGPEVRLLGDGALLSRALWNLIENAAKYGRPPIVLRAERAGNHVALSVTDDGEGIAVADREHVFLPFVRGDAARTPTLRTGAVGLGLTLVRQIAHVHGGSVTIGAARNEGDNAPGKEIGCRVTLLVPESGPPQRA